MVSASSAGTLPPAIMIISAANLVPRPVKEMMPTTIPASAHGSATVTVRSADTIIDSTNAIKERRVAVRKVPTTSVATMASSAAFCTG